MAPEGVYIANAGVYFPLNFSDKYMLTNNGESSQIQIKNIQTNAPITISYFKCQRSDPNKDCTQLLQNFKDTAEKKFTGEIVFNLTYDSQTRKLGFELSKDTTMAIGGNVVAAVKKACEDTDFQKYASIALLKKRRNPKLDLILSFKDGFVDPKTTFVQD